MVVVSVRGCTLYNVDRRIVDSVYIVVNLLNACKKYFVVLCFFFTLLNVGEQNVIYKTKYFEKLHISMCH